MIKSRSVSKIVFILLLTALFFGIAFNMLGGKKLDKTGAYLTSNGGIIGIIQLGGEQLKVTQALNIGDEPEETEKIIFNRTGFATDKTYDYDIRLKNTEKEGGADSKYLRWKWTAKIDGVEENVSKYFLTTNNSATTGTMAHLRDDGYVYLTNQNCEAIKLAPQQDVNILNQIQFFGEYDEESETYGSVLDNYYSGSKIEIYLTVQGSSDKTETEGEPDDDAWETDTVVPYLTYQESAKEVTITNFDGSTGEVVIPATYNGKPVTSIADGVFEDTGATITSLTIPGSVKSIGNLTNVSVDLESQTYQGSGFASLTSLTLEEGVEEIGDLAFPLPQITEVTIPSSVKSIGQLAFAMATSLTTVTFEENSQLESIGFSAFYYCARLQSIALPEGLTSTGVSTFYNCMSLSNVSLPNSLTIIDDGAFEYCKSLTTINIPQNVNTIVKNAFHDCISLRTVTFEDNSQLTMIASGVFKGCASLQSIEIPASVTSIGSSAFDGCTNLGTVTFADNSQLTSIGTYAFQNCTSLQTIEIPASVTSIGSYAFRHCTNLGIVTFVDNSQLTSIGYDAFYNCNNLGTVNISDLDKWVSIEFINSYSNPLYYGANLYLNGELVTNAVLTNATKINSYAFQNYTSLQTINIPAGVRSIGESAFHNCSSLQSIEIPEGVTSIGYYAFYNCTNLGTVTFADNSQLTSIEGGTFHNCSRLQTIEIPASVTSIGESAFYNCTNLGTVTFGEGSQLTSIGKYAFQNCTSLQTIEIPAGVTSIGTYAFYNCTKLANAYFGNKVGWTAGSTPIATADLENTSTAARYLRRTYSSSTWTRG